MNTNLRAGLLLVAFFAAQLLIAQSSTVAEDLQKADKQFDLYVYNLAMSNYQKVLKKEPNNGHALARIADCYFQLNQPEAALEWYSKAAYQSVAEPDVLLHYGQALMQTGDYEGAKKWFSVYQSDNELVGRHFVEMCDYARKTGGKESLYATKNESFINSPAADFAPAFLGNRLVFNSARTDMGRKNEGKSGNDWSTSATNQLFVTQRNTQTGFLEKPAFYKSELQNTPNQGPVTYSADGTRVVYSRNKFIDGTRQIAEKGLEMSLYTADVVNGAWTNERMFPYNGSSYATGFPALSPDGNTLYFASNNPEGYGGWDLYVCTWTGAGWGMPRNLGAALNTPGNEVTPFYDGLNLFFSSDWHRGLGGLDVFRAEMNGETVTNIYHLGPGINSSRDDYGFIFNATLKTGYLTSNRPGGRGNEDIYQVIKKRDDGTPMAAVPSTTTPTTQVPAQYSTRTTKAYTPQPVADAGLGGPLYLYVSDDSGRPVAGVTVDLSSCGGPINLTDASGKVYFSPASPYVQCTATLAKQGYLENVVDLETYGKNNILLRIGKDTRQEFTGLVLDSYTQAPLYQVIVEFSATETGKTIQTSTDFDGKYSVMMTPRTVYDVTYSREGYLEQVVKTRPVLTGTNNKIAPVLLSAYRQPGTTPTPVRPTAYSTPTTSSIQFKQPVEKVTPAEFNGYSIQLAAEPNALTDTKLQKYESLAAYGNLYTKEENGAHKVRLGIFQEKEEAQDVLKKVNKNAKFKGAFVTEERGADTGLIIGEQSGLVVTPAQYSAPTTTTTSSKGIPAGNSDIRYAVQVGSFATGKSVPVGDYVSKLAGLGNFYAKTENNSQKMRLGVWSNYSEAEFSQNEAVKRGFTDAIIVTEKATDENVQPFLINAPTPAAPAPAQYSTPAAQKKRTGATSPVAPTGPKYYIRLAALSNPDAFDEERLSGIGGTLEKRPARNGMTILLLGNLGDLNATTAAHNKLLGWGFDESYIVLDSDGKLNRLD